MGSPKRHIERLRIDLTAEWVQLPGLPDGLRGKLLADDLDEAARTGSRSRLIKFEPGSATSNTLVHEFWEEVLLISGDLSRTADPADDKTTVPVYSLRPPGTPHGPFISRQGCVLFEVQYFPRT